MNAMKAVQTIQAASLLPSTLPANGGYPGAFPSLSAESGLGSLTVYVSDHPVHEFAFRSAAEMVSSGEKLIVVDPVGCFHPVRMSQSARFGALDPAGILKHLHILRAEESVAFERVLTDLDSACEQFQTRRILIPEPLSHFYDPGLSTRDAARILGRVKSKLESLVAGGAQIVALCHQKPNCGTRSHFVLSLCASADSAYFRSST